MELFNNNFGDFSFDNDELLFIICTSIDEEFFTHLLITQTNFSEWFMKNYNGEEDTEDFMNELLERWVANGTYIGRVLEYYGSLSAEKKQDFFTQKWWEKLKFITFGAQLKSKLDLLGKKDAIRKMFKD
jgi:hypothetical protein